MRRPRVLSSLLVLLPGLLITACERAEGAVDSDARHDDGPHRVATILGARDPESVRYDPDQDLFFISMMNGLGSAKDDNGYILRVPADTLTNPTIFVEARKNGVTLHAPKGMAIHGDTLWVADIDALRGFDRRSGLPVGTIYFASQKATVLNDVAIGPDDRIYVTDTGIQMTEVGVIYAGGDRIFAVGSNRSIGVVAQGTQLRRPNGITWDARAKRWLVVDFDPWSSAMYTLRPGDTTLTVLARGKGKWDGVEALADGRILVSSWSDSSVHAFGADMKDVRLIHPVPEPADIGVDTRRGRVAVPVSLMGRVEVWALGARH